MWRADREAEEKKPTELSSEVRLTKSNAGAAPGGHTIVTSRGAGGGREEVGRVNRLVGVNRLVENRDAECDV